MSNKKQTAVEWLWEQIDNTIPFQNIEASQIFNGLLEQAKELQKQQIKEAYEQGEFDCGCNGTSEDYYNKTYPSKNKLGD